MENIRIKITNTYTFLRHHGFRPFVVESCTRFLDLFYDWYFNVTTATSIKLSEMGINVSSSNKDYVPISYFAIFSMLNRVPIEPKKISFLDYGSGKGRALAAAASKPFQKVAGVEFADKLCSISRENIASMRNKKSKLINIHHMDATKFDVPDDVNVVYFFNPFAGIVLENVINNIKSSLNRKPRKLYIIFINDDQFMLIIKNQKWLKKYYQTTFHPDYTSSIYETI